MGGNVTGLLPSLLQRSGAPLPSGLSVARTSPAVVVGTPDAHPLDIVRVLLREDGAPATVIRAVRDTATSGDPAQWFRAHLPALAPDRAAEYRVEWLRAGRRIAALPADGSWYHLVGAPDRTAPDRPVADQPAAEPQAPSGPRFGYGLEFFGAVTVDLKAERIGPTPQGYRINFTVTGGRVVGPAVDAVVEPGGGDWMCVRPDGIGEVDIKITLRNRDGALIFEQAGGVFDTGPDGYAQMAAGTLGGAPPLYVTPTWSTAHPAWTWLNRRQGIAFGHVTMATLQVRCDIYLPRVDSDAG